MTSPPTSTLLVQALCLLTSVVAVAFVSPQAQPTLHAVVVKLLPCLSLLLFMWTAQTPNHNDKAALTSSRETLLYLLGLETKLDTTTPAGKNKNVSKGKGFAETKFVLQRQLEVGTSRGLMFSMLGDAFMVWHETEALFMLGMLAFGIAQLYYIKGLGFGRVRVVTGIVTYGTLVCLSAVLLTDAPRLFQMLVPCYAALLATTLWRAIDRCGVKDGRPLWQQQSMALGAVVFVLSDASIALFKFVMKTRAAMAQYIILSTYFLAQTLLVFGAVAKQ